MYKISDKYKEIIYSGDAKHQLKIWFGETELVDADIYCEKLSVTSRIIPNGSKSLLLNNFVSKEAELILHDIEMPDITKQIKISIGTLIDEETQEYEYVPIGIFNIQDNPTTDKNKTTFKLRDNSVKFDANYNAKELLDTQDGIATKKQILQNICDKFGVKNNVISFYGETDEIGIYDNTITARTYIGYMAEQAGCIATIDREGNLVFVELNKEGEMGIVSDNFIYINDSLERNASSYNIKGKSEQETSVQGKNILALSEKTLYLNKFNFSYSLDGYNKITIDGTPTNYWQSMTFKVYPKETGNYIFYYKLGSKSNNITRALMSINKYSADRTRLKYKDCYISEVGNTISDYFIVDELGDEYSYEISIYLSANTSDFVQGEASYITYEDLYFGKASDFTGYEPFIPDSPSPDYPSEIKAVKGIRTLFKANVRGTYSGNEFKTLDYGHILINGHTTQGTRVKLTDVPVLLENGKKYTMSLTKLGGSCTNYSPENNFALQLYVGEKYINFSSSDLEKHYTFEGNGTEVIPYFWMPYNNTTTDIHAVFSNYQIGVQIKEGPIAHGYVPYGSWLKTEITGRNRFDKNKITKTNYFTSNGGQGKSVDWCISDYIDVIGGKDYNYQGLTDVGASPYSCYYDKDKNFISSFKQAIGINKITIPSNACYVRFSIKTSVSDENTFQFEEGTATEYEVYKKNEVLIDMNKPNLFDKDNAQEIKAWINNNNGLLTINQSTNSIIVKVDKNTNYTITRVASNKFRIGFYNFIPKGGETLINTKSNDTGNTITSNSGDNEYLIIYYYDDNSGNYTKEEILDSIKIYEGYTDYYELSSIGDTKDNLEVVSGLLTKRIGKVVLDGSEDWTVTTGADGYSRFNLVDYIPAYSLPNAMNNKLTQRIEQSHGSYEYLWLQPNVNVVYIQLETSRLTTNDVAGFKSWLSENPVTVYYVLAEEETIQLTPTNVPLFEGYNKVTLVEDLETETSIVYSQKKINYQIPIELIEKYEIKIPYRISKVLYEDAIRKFENGNEEYDTLYIDTANPYISSQSQINSIYNMVVNYSIDSLNTGKIIGNPAIDPYDIVEFTDIDLETNESKTYRTLATNDFVYNGVFIQTFDTDIGIEEKKTNVTINSEATFKKWARTEIDNVNAEIILQAGQISDTNANLEETNKNLQETNNNISENYYPKSQVEQLVLNSATGLTNTFSEAGGNNILKNTNFSANEVLEEGQIYEYWFGNVVRETNNSSVNGYSILLQNGNLNQDEIVANGPYTLSFYYKKTNPLANVYVLINGKQYNLDSSEVTLFQTGLKNEDGTYLIDPANVSDNHFKVEFVTDIDNSCEIYDIMANYGTIKLAYSQNANETITDTVNISKGITITSSTSEVKFTANNDGIRTKTANDEIITDFTDKGLNTKEAVVREEATIVGILRQRVGEQVWDSLI